LTRRSVQTLSDVFSKRICSLDTKAWQAVLTFNPRFQILAIDCRYLQMWIKCENGFPYIQHIRGSLAILRYIHSLTYLLTYLLVTFRVSRRRREIYCGHARMCVCLCVCLSAAACPHYCTDPDVTWESGSGCTVVVHHWADLQSVHGLRCYGNVTRTRNVS